MAYPKEADCIYIITTNKGSGLNIYVDDFHLDDPDGTNGCQSDWLQLFDGPKVNGPPISPRPKLKKSGDRCKNEHDIFQKICQKKLG